MKTLTKKEARKERLERHYKTLEKLSAFLGKKQDGKKLSLKLWKLEQTANKGATDYCNGENGMDSDAWDTFSDKITAEIVKVFGAEIPGLYINADARGYAIKIDDKAVKEIYPESIGLYRDWGGYGILSPEMEG